MNSYNQDGALNFSLSYKDGQKEQTYISDNNNDVYIKFYNDKPENIREVNKINPLNFIEYNLSLGEYIIFKEGNLIKAGKICEYNTVSPDVEVLNYNTTLQDEAMLAEVQPEVLEEDKDVPYIDIQDGIQINDVAETAIDIDIIDELEKEANDAMDIVDVEELEKQIEAIKQEHKELTKEVGLTNESEIKEILAKDKKADKETFQINLNLDQPTIKFDENDSNNSATLDVILTKDNKEEQDYNVENAIIPSAKEKKEQELAAKNIGPIAKPDINDLSQVVAKEHVGVDAAKVDDNIEIKTEKFYYPNGNLRKTIKTKGTRTEEIKEYSKTGLLLTDIIYNDDGILIEKYYGSGEVRRKTQKAYTDNVIMGFVSRIDFYNTGKPRYEIKRKDDTLLFEDKEFYPNGSLKQEIVQTYPIVFVKKEYNSEGKLSKENNIVGLNTLIKEYNDEGVIQKMLLNNKEVPVAMEKDSQKLLNDSAKVYNKNGKLTSEFIIDKNSNILKEYYDNGLLKTEIVFYNNGEISVKTYTIDNMLDKFAYLSPDGKLHIQKPEVRTIPSYRERYWVDYNNPKWIENQDKYSIKSIGILNLDTAAYMLTELKIEIPEMMKNIYILYQK